MAYINYVAKGEKKQSDWRLVSKLWNHKTKAGAFSGKFGVKAKDSTGNLVDTFDAITLKPGEPIMVRPNPNRREGKNDPMYLVYVLNKSE